MVFQMQNTMHLLHSCLSQVMKRLHWTGRLMHRRSVLHNQMVTGRLAPERMPAPAAAAGRPGHKTFPAPVQVIPLLQSYSRNPGHSSALNYIRQMRHFPATAALLNSATGHWTDCCLFQNYSMQKMHCYMILILMPGRQRTAFEQCL